MTLSMFNRPEYIWNTARCTLSNDISSKQELWAHKTSLTPPLFTEVTVPNQESELSCICELGVSILPLSTIFLLDFWTVQCKALLIVRYDFSMKTMFGSSLHPFDCRRARVLSTLFALYWCPTHIVLCFCFVILRLLYHMLPVSLDCPFLIAPLLFSNAYQLIRPYIFTRQ